MCELFAVSSREPVALCCSLDEFDRHGGGSAPHGDGWGLARFIDRDVLLVKEARPAYGSELARWVREHPMGSRLIVGHVRKATQGAHTLENSQPFVRERGGHMHVFAHNGHLERAALAGTWPADGAQPLGDTDSEAAFCALLAGLPRAAPGHWPALVDRLAVLAACATRWRGHGPANFLYADGELLFAHGHRRTQADGTIRPPGLWMLVLEAGTAGACPGLDAARSTGALTAAPATAGVIGPAVVLASVPLSDDARWQPLSEGEWVAVREGCIIGRSGTG